MKEPRSSATDMQNTLMIIGKEEEENKERNRKDELHGAEPFFKS
jgi:hypothetical protein